MEGAGLHQVLVHVAGGLGVGVLVAQPYKVNNIICAGGGGVVSEILSLDKRKFDRTQSFF